MFGHAQTVVDRAIAALGKQPRRRAHFGSRNAGQQGHRFRRILRLADEFGVVLEFIPIAAVLDELFVEQTFGHDHMRQSGDDGDVGAGGQGKVMFGLDMRAFHHLGAARIDHDQLGALAQALFQAAGKDRVAGNRVRADHDDHIGFFNRIKVLRASAGAQAFAPDHSRWANGRRARRYPYCCS